MTTQPDDQPSLNEAEDDEYLWSGKGPADPEITKLERALGSLKSKQTFDASALGDEKPTNVVRPAFWRHAAWVVPVAAAAAVTAWLLVRSPTEDVATRTVETSAPTTTSTTPPTTPATETAAGLAPAVPPPSCDPTPTGSGLAFELLDGAPAHCGDAVAAAAGFLPTGIWLTTQSGTRVRMLVPALGQVDVEPNSRVRVLATSATEHRLELAHGKIHAVIDAPPRLFFVQTRSALAIDLGCEYTLAIDNLGNGLLAVKTGFVELAVPAPEGKPSPLSSLVPKGASAALIDGHGPGLPVWDREPESVKSAARRVDADPGDSKAIDELLAGLGARDTLTMVHLLPRVPREAREKVLTRLAQLEPLPAALRAKAVAGDADALRAVRERFEARWFPKKSPTPR